MLASGGVGGVLASLYCGERVLGQLLTYITSMCLIYCGEPDCVPGSIVHLVSLFLSYISACLCVCC